MQQQTTLKPNNSNWKQKEKKKHTFSWKMWQGTILKPIWYSLSTDSLLTHTGNHLRDVDKGTLGSTQGHDERAVGVVKL